jgi:iron(III) transport system ATP-binding protein
VLDGGVIQQIGTPMDLYDHPANRFIADFVGTINLIAGRVTRDGHGLVFQSDTLGMIALPANAISEGSAEVAIRPHALTLAHTAGDPGRVWLEGVVTEREFLGEFVRYTVKVRDTELIADQPHFIGSATYAPGTAIKLGVNPLQLKLLA